MTNPAPVVAFDTETFPIWPGRLAPPIVCIQWDDGGGPRLAAMADPDGMKAARPAPVAVPIVEFVAEALVKGRRLVGHNVAYDLGVLGANFPRLLPAIFDALAEDRVTDTMIREKLVRIATNRNTHAGTSLADVCVQYGVDHGYHVGEDGKKEEYWRTRYGQLIDIPSDEWPEDARRYALSDASNTLAVYRAQERDALYLDDQYRQTRAAFALHLMTARGIRTDPEAVEAFITRTKDEIEEDRQTLVNAGLVRENGTKDKKAAQARMMEVCQRNGKPPKLTAKGKETARTGGDASGFIAVDKEACGDSGDPVLEAYARFTSANTTLARAERLRHGYTTPLQPRYSVLMETGRTSCSQGDVRPGEPVASWGTQIQNVRRAPGLRECYVARPGHVLISCDYSSAELHTLAQVFVWMFGWSAMAEKLKARKDLHLDFAATMMGVSYEEAKRRLAAGDKHTKEMRQLAKPFNFGKPGGMGDETFVAFAKSSYSVIITPEQSKEYGAQWLADDPAKSQYFAWHKNNHASGLPLRHFKSNRYRAGASYCASCNSFFQGLAADMAKDAAFRFARRCYARDLRRLSAFPLAFVHDEIIAEAPEDTAHEAALELKHTMEEAAREWCPDVWPTAEPALMRRWSKFAEPRFLDGRLVPWEDVSK